MTGTEAEADVEDDPTTEEIDAVLADHTGLFEDIRRLLER